MILYDYLFRNTKQNKGKGIYLNYIHGDSYDS